MDRLPPLNAIRAFESAARNMSITLAADELHVTPGAVSRHIRQLEDQLAIDLFCRGHRQISLTHEGTAYFRTVSQSIDQIRYATQKIKQRSKRKQLKVRAYTTFAIKWLIPRLTDFHRAFPDIDVCLTASMDQVDFNREDIDAAIRLGDGNWPGCKSTRLMSNILTPVVSRSFPEEGPKIKDVSDLKNHTLLHSMARPGDWRRWLEGAGVSDVVDAGGGMTYQTSAMAYAAAEAGQGIAMAQIFLVQSDLDRGSLVAPFPITADMGQMTYYLLTPDHREELPHLSVFKVWLAQQCEDKL